MSIFDFDLSSILPNKRSKVISRESLKDFMANKDTKRVHFASTHKNALREQEDGGDVLAWLNLPFADSINDLLSEKVGEIEFVSLNKNGRYSKPIKDESQLQKYKEVMEEYKGIVFLRDCLDISIALSMNLDENDDYTPIGLAEINVKYPNGKSIDGYQKLLVDTLQNRLEQFTILGNADCICCIPTNNPVLPQIVSQLNDFKFEDISGSVRWKDKFSSLKDAESLEDKLELLEQFGLVIDADVKGKNVLLLDDMYQSGLTMQYVAMGLKENGANRVYGVSLVKARNNKAYIKE